MTTSVPDNGKQIRKVLARHEEGEAGALVNVLHELQSEFRYLPEEALRLTAEHLGVSEAHVFGVATFYEGFHLEPRGEHVCTVCMGTACHVRGAPKLLDRLERDFGTVAGGTTADMKVTLETVNCVGACALGPLVIVDGEYNGNMTTARVEKLAKKIKQAGQSGQDAEGAEGERAEGVENAERPKAAGETERADHGKGTK